MKTNPIYEFEYDIKNWVYNNTDVTLDSYKFPEPQKLRFSFLEK